MLEARRKARQAEQEEALMLELERRKREEEARRLQIQLICESDPSLRDLQAKLQVSGGHAHRAPRAHFPVVSTITMRAPP